MVIECDANSQTTVTQAEVWRSLSSGERVVVESFSSGDRLLMLLRRQPVRSRPKRRVRLEGVSMLENALLAGSHKAVSWDNGASASGVSASIQNCLREMGWKCLPSKVPLLVMMLVRAAHAAGAPAEARTNVFGDSLDVVSILRTDRALTERLSPGENKVVGALVEGRTYAEIARDRGVSVRTVANQVASAFRRLGVSGRLELLLRLATASSREAPTVLSANTERNR